MLDKSSQTVHKNNFPGKDWATRYLNLHKSVLCNRLTQNIKSFWSRHHRGHYHRILRKLKGQHKRCASRECVELWRDQFQWWPGEKESHS